MKVMKRYILALTVLASGGLAFAQSGSEATDSVNQEQSQTVVKALFEYPVAPAEITGLQEKSDWLMEHFWDGFNPKKLKSVDQSALNHAFFVYATPMQWADKEKSIASVDRLIESLKKNPALMLQMTKAAEETLYGPRATMWIDEIYVRFLEALVKQKKLKDVHTARYQVRWKAPWLLISVSSSPTALRQGSPRRATTRSSSSETPTAMTALWPS